MKRVFIILLAAMMMFSSASLAENLSSASDEDLLVQYRRILSELVRRGIDTETDFPEAVFPGSALWDKEMADCLDLFFSFWRASDIPSMLTVCSSGWKADHENPGTDLLAVLGNRTPSDYEIVAVSMETAEHVRDVTLIAGMDRNDEIKSAGVVLRIAIVKEADGLWYADPGSLIIKETAEDMPLAEQSSASAEETPEMTDEPVLYYVPEGGQYYHADRNCLTVNEKFLPMSGSFSYAELENEAYKDLKPCEVCGAPARPENQ